MISSIFQTIFQTIFTKSYREHLRNTQFSKTSVTPIVILLVDIYHRFVMVRKGGNYCMNRTDTIILNRLSIQILNNSTIYVQREITLN